MRHHVTKGRARVIDSSFQRSTIIYRELHTPLCPYHLVNYGNTGMCSFRTRFKAPQLLHSVQCEQIGPQWLWVQIERP